MQRYHILKRVFFYDFKVIDLRCSTLKKYVLLNYFEIKVLISLSYGNPQVKLIGSPGQL